MPTPHWYENLGEDEFQKLCGVLIASRLDKVTCHPVGHEDGGRDLTRKTDVQAVYQVRWSKDAVKNPVTCAVPRPGGRGTSMHLVCWVPDVLEVGVRAAPPQDAD